MCTIPHHEQDLFWSISRTQDMLELLFSQWTLISMGQTKVTERGCDPGRYMGKHKKLTFFQKININLDNY